jgi:AcrR family transcriptional regulator
MHKKSFNFYKKIVVFYNKKLSKNDIFMKLYYNNRKKGVEVSKEEKKEIIMQTALNLFAKQGFYNTTIADIAKEMEMSVGNMYNYFPSKESLAKELLIYTSKKFGDEIKKLMKWIYPLKKK